MYFGSQTWKKEHTNPFPITPDLHAKNRSVDHLPTRPPFPIYRHRRFVDQKRASIGPTTKSLPRDFSFDLGDQSCDTVEAFGHPPLRWLRRAIAHIVLSGVPDLSVAMPIGDSRDPLSPSCCICCGARYTLQHLLLGSRRLEAD